MTVVMEVLKAILFGILEGVTEWLPVSSTGHLILLQDFVSLDVSKEFYKLFEVVIQLGAILAVVILFWDKIWIFKRREGSKKREFDVWTVVLWVKIVAACIPAAVVGVFFDDEIDELFYNPIMVAVALIVVGIVFLVTESWVSDKEEVYVNSAHKIGLKDAMIIGLFQLLAAVLPGTSRSGATIVGGLILGLSRKAAAEFTFYLAIPVMFGASLLKGAKFLIKGVSMTGTEVSILVVGTLTSFLVSLYVIRFLMGYIKKHDFKGFGYYRIALGIAILFYQVLDF